MFPAVKWYAPRSLWPLLYRLFGRRIVVVDSGVVVTMYRLRGRLLVASVERAS